MIVKVKGGYKVVSSKEKNLGGPYKNARRKKQQRGGCAKWSSSSVVGDGHIKEPRQPGIPQSETASTVSPDPF